MTIDAPDPKDAEIARLRRGIGDIAALIALSASWQKNPAQIAKSLSEALPSLLSLDFVYLEGSDGTENNLAHRSGDFATVSGGCLARELRTRFGTERSQWPGISPQINLGGVKAAIATIPLGRAAAHGIIVVGAALNSFPNEMDRLIISTARNQALLACRDAELLDTQRKGAESALSAEIFERRRAEAALQASELAEGALIDGIPGLAAILAPDGSVQHVNREILEYFGQTHEELRGWSMNGTIHPDDLPALEEAFGAAIIGGSGYDLEHRMRRADGVYRWCSNRGRPLRDETGDVTAWHVLLADIDDRKSAEESLRASERHLRQQTETFPLMLWSATADGNIEYCNERLLEYSGLDAQTVLGDGWVNLLHPDDRARAGGIWTQSISTGAPYSVEVRHFHVADRSYRWILTMALPLRDATGQIIKWYGSCVDIHDRKLAEDALKASERQLAQIVDTIPAYLFGAGTDGLVNYLNPQMRSWFGRAEESIMAEEWVHLVHPDDREVTLTAWMDTVAAGTPYHHELRFMHNSGDYRWCDIQARPVLDKGGGIVAWYGVVTDVHEQKLAEHALRISERDLRLTIDSIPALAWSAQADGKADFFNKNYLDYTGSSNEALLDWQWTSAVHPDDLPTIANAWEVARDTDMRTATEARVRRHDGVYRWFSFHAAPLRNENGEVVKWFGVNSDIDDMKRSTQLLAGERQLLELVASGSPLRDVLEALCVVVEGVIPECRCEVRLLDESAAVFDFGVAPSLPVDFTDLISGMAARQDLAPCGLAVTSNAQVVAENIETDPRWYEAIVRSKLLECGLKSVWSTPISSIDGKILGTLCVYHARTCAPRQEHQDIIARVTYVASITIARFRAEDELRRREYLLAAAERISETGSFHWDMLKNKLVWSAQMYRIHEMDRSIEPTYFNSIALVHPDDVDLVNGQVGQAFSGVGDPDNGYRLLMPDGRIKYLKTAYEVFKHQDGRLEGIGVAQDVTQRRLAENANEKLRSELAHITRVSSLGELTASIAHEVNQPLSGIITNASTCLRMLAADPPDIDGAIRTAKRSIRDGGRASEIIRRLRGLYKKQDFEPIPFEFNHAVREVIGICSHDMQRRGIHLKIDLDTPLPSVVGDRIQLQQVVLNLIMNAADALGTVAGPREICVISREIPDEHVQLSVRDNGVGIADQDIDKLFDAFFTTKPDGMGIGLSVSRSIVERHAGKLWARQNDDAGATFAFSMPRSNGNIDGLRGPHPSAGQL